MQGWGPQNLLLDRKLSIIVIDAWNAKTLADKVLTVLAHEPFVDCIQCSLVISLQNLEYYVVCQQYSLSLFEIVKLSAIMLTHFIALHFASNHLIVLIEANVAVAKSHHFQGLNISVWEVCEALLVHFFTKIRTVQARKWGNRSATEANSLIVHKTRCTRVWDPQLRVWEVNSELAHFDWT